MIVVLINKCNPIRADQDCTSRYIDSPNDTRDEISVGESITRWIVIVHDVQQAFTFGREAISVVSTAKNYPFMIGPICCTVKVEGAMLYVYHNRIRRVRAASFHTL